VPSVGLVVAGDAVYNDVHLYLAESNAQTRREWITALDIIESLKPRAVIAGHKKPDRDDSPEIIEETRQYIRDFERVASMTATAGELYDAISRIRWMLLGNRRCLSRRKTRKKLTGEDALPANRVEQLCRGRFEARFPLPSHQRTGLVDRVRD